MVVGAIGFLRWVPLRAIPWFLALSSLAFVCVGVGAEIAFGFFSPLSGGYRFAGTLGPNTQAVNCALLLLSGMWIATEPSRRYRWLGILLAVAGLVFLLATRSRTSVGSGIAAAFVLVLLRFRPGSKFLIVTLGINLAVLLLFLGANGWFEIPNHLLLLGREGEGGVGTLNSRLPLWILLFDYIAQRPLAGFGFNGFMSPEHAAQIGTMFLFGVSGAHSLYVELLLGVGLIGLALFAVGLFAALVRAFRESAGPNSNSETALFGAVITFEMLSGVLESTLIFPSWRFPSLLVIVALSVIATTRVAPIVSTPSLRWTHGVRA
jgi:O-antigen ligase